MRSTLLSSLLAGALALTSPLSAQCSSLTVDGDGTPGSTLSFELTGLDANTPVVVLAARDTGDFSFSFGPMGSLDLGIVPPWRVVGVGVSDGDGNAAIERNVPPGIPGSADLHAQGLGVGIDVPRGKPGSTPPMPAFNFCPSDVVAFTVGS
ncbi:MAG: hypothetical protein ACYTG5_00850 [Planctomycetota bacterium]|jgi:hypothetical protein